MREGLLLLHAARELLARFVLTDVLFLRVLRPEALGVARERGLARGIDSLGIGEEFEEIS